MAPLILRSGFCILGLAMAIGPADAAVYCKYAGVPKGCVARPGAMIAPGPRVVRHGAVRSTPRRGQFRRPRQSYRPALTGQSGEGPYP